MNLQESIQLQSIIDEKVDRYYNSVSKFLSETTDRKCVIVVDKHHDLFFKIKKMLRNHQKELTVIRASNTTECQSIIEKNKNSVKGILFEFDSSENLSDQITKTTDIKIPIIMIMRELKNNFNPKTIPELEHILAV